MPIRSSRRPTKPSIKAKMNVRNGEWWSVSGERCERKAWWPSRDLGTSPLIMRFVFQICETIVTVNYLPSCALQRSHVPHLRVCVCNGNKVAVSCMWIWFKIRFQFWHFWFAFQWLSVVCTPVFRTALTYAHALVRFGISALLLLLLLNVCFVCCCAMGDDERVGIACWSPSTAKMPIANRMRALSGSCSAVGCAGACPILLAGSWLRLMAFTWQLLESILWFSLLASLLFYLLMCLRRDLATQSTLVYSNCLLVGTISQSLTHSRAPLLTYTVNLLAVYPSDDLFNRLYVRSLFDCGVRTFGFSTEEVSWKIRITCGVAVNALENVTDD